jgi:hypothetical protein
VPTTQAISVIVSWSEGLGRDLEALIDLGDRGYRVASATGEYDLSDSDHRFVLRIKVAQAEKESDDKSRRIKRRFQGKRERGVPHPTARRFGFAGWSDTLDRGDRPGENKTRALLEVLRDRPADVLRFVHDPAVPPTSNQAERDLRPSKCQQNVSGRLTSEDRTRDRYIIRGYVSTAIKHGRDAITALRDTLTGHPWIPALPAPT